MARGGGFRWIGRALAVGLLGCSAPEAGPAEPAVRVRWVEPDTPCNSTQTCRERAAARVKAFAEVIAAEPPSPRLPLERTDWTVLTDRGAGVVYALDDALVALDLASGAERWRLADVRGGMLWRVGAGLAVTAAATPKSMAVTFVLPTGGEGGGPWAKRCELALPVPAEANEVSLHPFDRGGQALVYWSSAYRYNGGVEPGPEIHAQMRRAAGCGVAVVDVPTCTAVALPIEKLTWSGARPVMLNGVRAGLCEMRNPLQTIPSAAASEPPGAAASTDGGAEMRLAVELQHENERCRFTTHRTLVAKQGAVEKWRFPLADAVRYCPPP
ncbi:MAG: hypothetical protein H6747_11335 [Deltaproteobacteria bacterium]|nr:hypothetical protein [Deltaproteobacteria bacterium]